MNLWSRNKKMDNHLKRIRTFLCILELIKTLSQICSGVDGLSILNVRSFIVVILQALLLICDEETIF